jgi:hypothetical protein
MADINPAALDYAVSNSRSRQWDLFLHTFASEFSREAAPDELRGLMRRLGASMAGSLPFDAGDSIPGFEAAANRHWSAMQWGWCQLSELADGLLIEHYAAPLAAAFGESSLAWSSALLEGVYAEWLKSLGSPASLSLAPYGEADATGRVLRFRLGR